MKLNFDWGGGQASEQGGRQEVGKSQPEGGPGVREDGCETGVGKKRWRTSELSPSLKNGRGGQLKGLNLGEQSNSQDFPSERTLGLRHRRPEYCGRLVMRTSARGKGTLGIIQEGEPGPGGDPAAARKAAGLLQAVGAPLEEQWGGTE